MNARVLIAALGFLGALDPVIHAQTADRALNVHVIAAQLEARKDIDKELRKQLKQVADETKNNRTNIEKQLKAQHGNKPDAWPLDKQNLLYDAQEAEALAAAELAYRTVNPAALSDTADDIKKALAGAGGAGKKENVIVVQSPAEAHLVVEVVGRRSEEQRGTDIFAVATGASYWVSFLIKPGPKLTGGQFASVPRTYRFHRVGRSAWRLQTPRPEAPYWRFDAYGDTRWFNAASTASIVIEDFIAKHYDGLSVQTR